MDSRQNRKNVRSKVPDIKSKHVNTDDTTTVFEPNHSSMFSADSSILIKSEPPIDIGLDDGELNAVHENATDNDFPSNNISNIEPNDCSISIGNIVAHKSPAMHYEDSGRVLRSSAKNKRDDIDQISFHSIDCSMVPIKNEPDAEYDHISVVCDPSGSHDFKSAVDQPMTEEQTVKDEPDSDVDIDGDSNYMPDTSGYIDPSTKQTSSHIDEDDTDTNSDVDIDDDTYDFNAADSKPSVSEDDTDSEFDIEVDSKKSNEDSPPKSRVDSKKSNEDSPPKIRRNASKKKKKQVPNKVVKKSLQCDLCQKSYSSKDHLLAHMDTIHIGVKRFECPIEECSLRFARECNLKRHIDSVHTGLKPYACSFANCSKYFSDNRNLQRHINCLHTRSIVFECTKCSKKFYDKSHLKRHLNHFCKWSTLQREKNPNSKPKKPPLKQKKVPKIPFSLKNFGNSFLKCPFCAKGFTSISSFKQHSKSQWAICGRKNQNSF